MEASVMLDQHHAFQASELSRVESSRVESSLVLERVRKVAQSSGRVESRTRASTESGTVQRLSRVSYSSEYGKWHRPVVESSLLLERARKTTQLAG